ncbi:MAG: glycosyltransferase, partial [Betaproteobacteria bacterium]
MTITSAFIGERCMEDEIQSEKLLKVLTISRVFPNERQPNYGVFVANRLRLLALSGELQFRVVAPVAWRIARKADASIPTTLEQHGYQVDHPRFLWIPKLGFPIAPLLLYLSVARHVRQLMREGYEFDIIDAHFFFPDGVTAVMLGNRFAKPVVVTARGSDLNHQAKMPFIGYLIRWAIRHADWIITVTSALKCRAIELGATEEKVTVLRNGIDIELFKPTRRDQMRAHLQLVRTTLLCVGNLVQLKGHHLVIEAMRLLPDTDLLIIGEGPERARLETLVSKRKLSGRVRLLGSVAHRELPPFYSAADIFVLASSREGWPNVTLEAMACGTPVVATNVGGIPEI